MNTVDFFILTETYTWTFELFIGALGGVLGVWLGLDFGVLLDLVFKPITMIFRKLLSRNGESNQCPFNNGRRRVPQFYSTAQIRQRTTIIQIFRHFRNSGTPGAALASGWP